MNWIFGINLRDGGKLDDPGKDGDFKNTLIFKGRSLETQSLCFLEEVAERLSGAIRRIMKDKWISNALLPGHDSLPIALSAVKLLTSHVTRSYSRGLHSL
jgi:hypothetical protein